MKSACGMLVLLLAAAAAGCGKKGAPLPPLLRIPAMVGEPTAVRLADDVYVRFVVPTTNVTGEAPADIARVEVYAITANRPPTERDDPATLRRLSTLVGSHPVRRPVPPVPPPAPGQPPPPLPPTPGVDQGSEVVVHETLTPDMFEVVPLPERTEAPLERDRQETLPGPLVAPTDSGAPTRYYYAVGVSPRGRYSPAGALLPVPLGATSSAPARPELSHDAENITIKWLPAPDARGLRLHDSPDALPAKPLLPPPPPTTYDVYEVAKSSNETPAMPIPVTPAPIGALEFARPIETFGVERCFYVRPVDVVDGYHVRGPASPTACLTPKDTFPPEPPRALAAVATEAAINLIWEPSESGDLAGYMVMRSRLPDETMQPAMEQPMTGTTFVDKGVRPGVTYAYVVIAIDKAGNRSQPSNRVEETAQQ